MSLIKPLSNVQPDPESGLSVSEEDSRRPSELPKAELERLGRERPAVFPNALSEILFCFSLLLSMLMAEYLVSGFNLVLPKVSSSLQIPPSLQIWSNSVFSLTTGAFLLPFGRLADMYGGHAIFVSGLVWFAVFTLAAGFSPSPQMLIVFRALGGLGPAAFLPTGIMLLGKTYRPGPRKNLVFSLYGAAAPLGFGFGLLMGGVMAQWASWRWWFWIAAILLGLVCVTAFWTVPRDFHEQRKEGVKMDWWGAVTIVPALLLVVFAFTDGAHAEQGWKTPYIVVTLVVGVVLLGVAVWVEGWVAEHPLLPFDLFAPRYMGALTVALWFTYGSFGVVLYYANFYIETIMQTPPILAACYFLPMIIIGILLGSIGGLVLHRLPGKLLLLLSGVAGTLTPLLFALIPSPQTTYWAFIFPAMVCCTIGIDITYNVSNVFITTNVPGHRQGVAGALINSLLFLGISFFLGLADLAVSENGGEEQGYKVAFWFATACSGLALGLFCYVRLGKATSQLTVEETAAKDGDREEK